MSTTKYALSLIEDECHRVQLEEGFTPEHDLQHDKGQLAEAAAYYCFTQQQREFTDAVLAKSNDGAGSSVWPFEPQWFKPSPEDRIKELVKAGQFIIAEIVRLESIKFDQVPDIEPNGGANWPEWQAAFKQAMRADGLPESDLLDIDLTVIRECYDQGYNPVESYKANYWVD